MNFENWRATREAIISANPDLVRLDCMNPFKALDHMAFADCEVRDNKRLESACSGETESIAVNHDQLAHTVLSCLSVSAPTKRLVFTIGIRSFLSLFFANFSREKAASAWMPQDVFPTYFTIAESAGWSTSTYQTIPEPEWEKSSKNSSVAILPVPLSPLGRDLHNSEIQFWFDWLDQDEMRVLIVDAVYAYEAEQLIGLTALREHSRCIVVWSVSKTFLSRCVFGFAEIDDTLLPRFKGCSLPKLAFTQNELTLQVQLQNRLQIHSKASKNLPQRQKLRFREQWNKLRRHLQAVDPNWLPPRTGYFAVLNMNYKDLIANHRLLSVPASVFGSRHAAQSVITCLYDIKQDDINSDSA